MITKQSEYTLKEIERRAKENSEMYFEALENYPEGIDCENTNLEEPKESFYW
jgi:predicted RNase H-like HicB family nuclease